MVSFACTPKADILAGVSAGQLVQLLRHERPQTIALLLAGLPASKGAELLKLLPSALHADLLQRLAHLAPLASAEWEELAEQLREQSQKLSRGAGPKRGGVQAVAALLRLWPPAQTEKALAALASRHADLSAQIAKHLFTFDDLAQLTQEEFAKIRQRVPADLWPKALKIASANTLQRVLASLSSRAAASLQEDMAALAPVRRQDAEQAQADIVAVMLSLEKQGELPSLQR